MFEETVTTKNGVEKRIVAQSQEELAEAVKIAKAEQSAEVPNIHNPEDGNKIVSPENRHTESVPPVVDNNVETVPEEVTTPKKK